MEILSGMIEYAMFYENSEHNGSSTGRSGTTKNIVKSALNDAKYFFVGSGFGSYKDEEATKERNVIYGIVGLHVMFSLGDDICCAYVFMAYKVILYHDKTEQDPFPSL